MKSVEPKTHKPRGEKKRYFSSSFYRRHGKTFMKLQIPRLSKKTARDIFSTIANPIIITTVYFSICYRIYSAVNVARREKGNASFEFRFLRSAHKTRVFPFSFRFFRIEPLEDGKSRLKISFKRM